VYYFSCRYHKNISDSSYRRASLTVHRFKPEGKPVRSQWYNLEQITEIWKLPEISRDSRPDPLKLIFTSTNHVYEPQRWHLRTISSDTVILLHSNNLKFVCLILDFEIFTYPTFHFHIECDVHWNTQLSFNKLISCPHWTQENVRCLDWWIEPRSAFSSSSWLGFQTSLPS